MLAVSAEAFKWVISVIKIVKALRCGTLFGEVESQYPVKVMDLYMDKFMAFHHHFLILNNSTMQADLNSNKAQSLNSI
jgi:hypothetical protein